MSDTTAPPPCPECAAGKPGNCDGTTWDVYADAPAPCPGGYARADRQLLPPQIVSEVAESGTGTHIHLRLGASSHGGAPTSRLRRRPKVGETVAFEVRRGSTIIGLWSADDGWLFRVTDREVDADHAATVTRNEREKQNWVEANRAKLTAQEAALPGWLRDRIERFRAAAGDKFDIDGWGYELAVCRLAAAMAAGNEGEVDRIDREVKGSGNQHGCARALVARHAADPAGTELIPAALSPITGSADYS